MATNGAVNTNSYNDAYLRLEWTRTSYDSAAGINYVHWVLKGVKSSSGFYVARNFKVTSYNFVTGNTTELYYSESDINLYDGTVIAEGDDSFIANPDGSCTIQFNIEGAIYTYAVNCTGYDAWDLDQIPRYPTNCTISLNSKTINSIKVNWSAGQNCSQVQYRINGGSWVDTLPSDSKQSSGSFTITGREPNTQYKIECDFQRADSGQWSSYNDDIPTINVKTNNKSIVYGTDFNLGSNEDITFTNPNDGSKIQTAIYLPDAKTSLADYRTVTGTSYAFKFTDEELDRIYKQFRNSNEITVRIYNRTTCNGVSYLDYSVKVCKLTGNQKTGHINVNNSWKRAKKWVNVNGTWKRCIRWVNVNGTWKRCI